MSISLYNIESALAGLMQLRELAEAEGDSEALAVADKEIKAYLSAEAQKVTNYVSLIRNETLAAQACEEEAERFADMAKRKRATIQRLKDIALEAMQAFGVKELKATPGGGLRRQANGGIEPLEVLDNASLPKELQLKSITMNVEAWETIGKWLGMHEGGLIIWHTLSDLLEGQQPQASTHFIRNSLKRGESITGAKLLPRGEHVRVI